MMSILFFIQRTIEVVIAIAIVASPAYKSAKWCFAISACLAALWVVVRMMLIAFFDSPATPPIGYLILPVLIFIWMIVVRFLFRVIRKIVLTVKGWVSHS